MTIVRCLCKGFYEPPNCPFHGRSRSKWQGEICKRCGRRNVVGFLVSDRAWRLVVMDRWNVVCAACFDEEAERAGVRYKFISVYPATWNDWDVAKG